MGQLGAEDLEELKTLVAEAFADALRKHCRFPDEQAETLHEAAKRLSPDDVIAVAWLAKRMREIADSAGHWFARLVFLGLLALLVLGAGAFLWAIHKGWLAAPGP
jgi:hypothetical protein